MKKKSEIYCNCIKNAAHETGEGASATYPYVGVVSKLHYIQLYLS